MSDTFDVDTAVEFNDDATVNIIFKNVALDDVQYLFDAMGDPAFQEQWISGLITARLQRTA